MLAPKCCRLYKETEMQLNLERICRQWSIFYDWAFRTTCEAGHDNVREKKQLGSKRKIIFKFVISKTPMDFDVPATLWCPHCTTKSKSWTQPWNMSPLIFGNPCPSQIRFYPKDIALAVSIRGSGKHHNLRLASSEAEGIGPFDEPERACSLSLGRGK